MVERVQVTATGTAKQNGGARPGAGRPKGVPNKVRMYPTLRGEVVVMRQKYEVMPVDHMLKLINTRFRRRKHGENIDKYRTLKRAYQERQDAAARAAAPFMHYKLASIEHSGKDGEPIRHQVDLSRLSDAELQILEKLTAKANIGDTVDLDQQEYKVIDDSHVFDDEEPRNDR